MNIYVASSWRCARQPAVVAALRAAGHEVYDFKNPAPGNTGFGWRQIRPDPPPWSAEVTREVLTAPRAEEGFKLDFDAMRWADADAPADLTLDREGFDQRPEGAAA